jgi:hypothetical protein
VSEADGTETGPVEERTRRSGRPPVPTAAPSEQPAGDGRHRTERVPFPLPPLQGEDRPRPVAPPTEQLPVQPGPGARAGQDQPGGYPPRVPGGPRPRPAAPAAEPPAEDGADER